MPISFTGDHLRRLQAALLDAFDYGALRQMLQIELDADLDHLVAFRTATLAEMVHDLVRHYARRQGGIQQLLRAAHNALPADVELSALYQEWIVLDFAPLAPLPPATAPAIPQQRPPRAEHFMDRQQALTQLLAALQPGAVVTLCGPGGIGKTALAAEALWQLPGERFPDGVITHSFYGRGQIDLACEHIARTLGEELKPNPCAAAQRALAGRQLLLLLDGAEEADDLPALLAIRGNCGVLVTSRRRSDALAVRHDVDPLPLADAIALLQAWGGQRASDITAAGAIAELVGRLPLALRLVGRYLAQHEEDAADYLAWLQDTPLAALDRGNRREQSVPLLLARSLAQVNEIAQAALGVVGLLALIPFDTDAIAVALGLSERATLSALGELVNYGLLLRPDEHYAISHTLIHTYAREHIAPPNDVIERLAAHYTGVIETHAADFARLNTLRFHVVAILSACITHHIWSAVSDLAWAIDTYLDLQGYSRDRLSVINAALTAAQVKQDQYSEGAWLGNLATTYLNLGQTEDAIVYYQQALTISRAIGDRRGEDNRLGNLGLGYAALGQMDAAIECHQQALAIAQEIGNRYGEGNHLGNLGLAYTHLGQMKIAIDYFQQALNISRAIGNQRGEGSALGNLGLAYKSLGQLETAIEYYKQALAISRTIGDRHGECADLGNLGNAYFNLGQVTHAIDYHRQALAIAQEIGDRRSEGNHWGNLGSAYAVLSQVTTAIEYHRQALAVAREIGDRFFEGAVLGNLGNAYRNLGQAKLAIIYYQQALAIAQQIGNRQNEGICLGNIGLANADLGKMEAAIAYYQQALTIAQEISDRCSEGNHLGNLGLAYAALGKMEAATEHYQQALIIAQETGDRRNEGNHLGNLGLVYTTLGQVTTAIEYYQQALAITHEIGDRYGESNHLGNLGSAYRNLGQVEAAIEHYQQALAITRQTGDRRKEGAWLGGLGNAYQNLGQIEAAIEHYQQALKIAQEISDRHNEGICLANLGMVYETQGDLHHAGICGRAALAIFDEIGSPNAERVRRWFAILKYNGKII